MAVFPDRIVLKNSTDSQAAIEAAIQAGGTDEITQGEIVLGLETGSAQLYTRDATGAIVTISGGGGAVTSIIAGSNVTISPTNGLGDVTINSEGGGGRGDGGDFDTGTVDAGFVFGVYGGGDFDAGSAATTAVAPFAHAYIDSNNISSITAHAGMSSAAHVYVASTDSYIDFTFDTAQPNTDYSVLHSGEAGWNVLEVENKTTSGFRISFYDEATGNVLTTGAVGIGAPVITVYDSDPTVTIDSSAGVDLPTELLSDDEGPDGGSF